MEVTSPFIPPLHSIPIGPIILSILFVLQYSQIEISPLIPSFAPAFIIFDVANVFVPSAII